MGLRCRIGIWGYGSLIFHACHRHLPSFGCEFLYLIHNLDALDKSVDCGACILNFFKVSVHLFEVLLNELINDLGR